MNKKIKKAQLTQNLYWNIYLMIFNFNRYFKYYTEIDGYHKYLFYLRLHVLNFMKCKKYKKKYINFLKNIMLFYHF